MSSRLYMPVPVRPQSGVHCPCGFPAQSGEGGVFTVIPGLGGFCAFSPRLDRTFKPSPNELKALPFQPQKFEVRECVGLSIVAEVYCVEGY